MIAIISDTHIPRRAKKIPKQFLKKIEQAEKTVHAGDLETAEVHKQVEQRSQKLYAVMGNCDKIQLPQNEIFNENQLSIGAYHGTGINPRGHTPTLLDIAKNKLKVDILIHGHTHKQDTTKEDGILLVNPGSATGVGGGTSKPGNPKMSTLEVKEDEVEITEIEINDGELRENKKKYSRD